MKPHKKKRASPAAQKEKSVSKSPSIDDGTEPDQQPHDMDINMANKQNSNNHNKKRQTPPNQPTKSKNSNKNDNASNANHNRRQSAFAKNGAIHKDKQWMRQMAIQCSKLLNETCNPFPTHEIAEAV